MPRTAAPLAHDEDHWRAIARQFDIDPGPINLENGYFGRMTRKVAEEYQHNIQWVNRSNSVHARQRFEQIEALQIRGQLAVIPVPFLDMGDDDDIGMPMVEDVIEKNQPSRPMFSGSQGTPAVQPLADRYRHTWPLLVTKWRGGLLEGRH